MNPVDMADNLKKYGGFVPGIRPGQRTSDYIYSVLTKNYFCRRDLSRHRLRDSGVSYLQTEYAFLFRGYLSTDRDRVGLDTAQQIESHLLNRNYDGFLQKGKLRGRTT